MIGTQPVIQTCWPVHRLLGMADQIDSRHPHAHDKALMGDVAVPEPDELLADIMALETWRAQIEKRSAETTKKRKAGPATAAPAAAAA